MSDKPDEKVMILEQWPFQVVDLTETTIWEKQQIKDGMMPKEGTCATCKHWQAPHGRYAAACTSKKAGLGAVTQRAGTSAICRWDFDPLGPSIIHKINQKDQ